jgi:hypothetical protein
MALSLFASADAAAQGSCISTLTTPGLVYPLLDPRLIRDGDLPQIYGYGLKEDRIDIRVDDGIGLNLAPNEMSITLVSNVTWAKEIVAWNFFSGYGTTLYTKDQSRGPISMRITRGSCASTTHTIVLRKAGWFPGSMYDMYHFDPGNFWTLWGGKSVTITWGSDNSGDPEYPPYCPSPCVPVGTLAPRTLAAKLVGDFNNDGRADIALTGKAGWGSVPVAFSNGDGTFSVTNAFVGEFAAWASQPGVKPLVGDFNNDGRADIALTGGAGWSSIPVAFSNGDGSFRVTNVFVGEFAAWASQPGVKPLIGDFNNDGKIDIALTGGGNWGSVPVAFSNGDGSFRVTNVFVGEFAAWAARPGVKPLVGDFNNDGKTDIALTGGVGWHSIPVAFSNGDGSFSVTNAFVGDFAAWASPGVKKLVGDFNGDGKTDIALIGGTGWNTLPVAFSNGDGTFTVTNRDVGFGSTGEAARWVLESVVGDFDGDRKADIAMFYSGGHGLAWLFRSRGDGTFEQRISCVGYFGSSANELYATKLVGDFNNDGKADVALTGGIGWDTLPVAFGNAPSAYIGPPAYCYQDFALRNFPIGDFAGWSAP